MGYKADLIFVLVVTLSGVEAAAIQTAKASCGLSEIRDYKHGSVL